MPRGMRSGGKGLRMPRVPRPKGATVPRIAVKPPTSVFEGLPQGSIGKHLGQFNKTLDYLKGATGGRF